MLAVSLSESELAPYIASVLDEDCASALTCACINSPRNTTVSGMEPYIDKLAQLLQSDKIFARKLEVSVAYHSMQMHQIAGIYRNQLEGSLFGSETTGSSPLFFSSVTGTILAREQALKADYWVSNLVSRVKFSEAVRLMSSLNGEGIPTNDPGSSFYMIEIGPHRTLQRSIQETFGKETNYIYDSVIRRNYSSMKSMKEMVGKLVMNGYPVNIQAVNSHSYRLNLPKMLLDLPPYPFNHSKSYWLESRLSKNRRLRERPRHELLGNPSTDWNPLEPKWRFTIRVSDLPWILDHKVIAVQIQSYIIGLNSINTMRRSKEQFYTQQPVC